MDDFEKKIVEIEKEIQTITAEIDKLQEKNQFYNEKLENAQEEKESNKRNLIFFFKIFN